MYKMFVSVVQNYSKTRPKSGLDANLFLDHLNIGKQKVRFSNVSGFVSSPLYFDSIDIKSECTILYKLRYYSI